MRLAVLLSVMLIAPSTKAANKKRAPTPPPDIEDVAAQLMGRALTSDGAMDKLIELCDDIGHRLSGSPQLQQAVTWGRDKMAAEGLQAHLEPVMVPAWIRGHQKATLKGPVEQSLNILTLGNSVGTPDGPVEGDVVVVGDWDELAALGDQVKGKIVLYDVPFTTYGDTVQYRGKGASEAAKLGAVAAMVRSVGPVSLDTPHTGAMYYAEDVPKIPSVAVTIEDASTMRRLQDRGQPMRVSLDLGAHFIEDQPSHNVVGEIRGRDLPEEVVLMGCHLDSWDVGQGAQDDGAGCTAIMEAGRLIAALPVAPRRTVRVVLFTNEENGLRGGKAYGEAHGDERIVAAMEMDTGAGAPQGWRVDARHDDEAVQAARTQQAIDALQPVSRLLAPLNATELTAAYGGADIGPLAERGHLTMGLKMDTSGYWPIHHTRADTIDKIDPQNLRRNVAALAVTTWWLAENPEAPLD
jgi:Zn-dependent M28 family amino/carboxypeptidase